MLGRCQFSPLGFSLFFSGFLLFVLREGTKYSTGVVFDVKANKTLLDLWSGGREAQDWYKEEGWFVGKIRNKEQRMMKETKRKEELELAALYGSHIYIYIYNLYWFIWKSNCWFDFTMCAVTWGSWGSLKPYGFPTKKIEVTEIFGAGVHQADRERQRWGFSKLAWTVVETDSGFSWIFTGGPWNLHLVFQSFSWNLTAPISFFETVVENKQLKIFLHKRCRENAMLQQLDICLCW